MRTVEWFDKWFDSPYYHILYKNRDYNEAGAFIDKLVDYLAVKPHHKILDLACGKGRHSIYLNKKGFDVVGADLSEQSIAKASQYANDRLHFEVHDMREEFAHNEFDFILNLFTSFGYFETKAEHEQAIHSVAEAMKDHGVFVLDFLNPYTVINHLTPIEEKQIEGINFHISKDVSDDDYILKDIRFTDEGEDYHFQEKVKALRRADFLEYFEKSGLKVIDIFGDYDLNSYLAEKSERMIFVVEKQL